MIRLLGVLLAIIAMIYSYSLFAEDNNSEAKEQQEQTATTTPTESKPLTSQELAAKIITTLLQTIHNNSDYSAELEVVVYKNNQEVGVYQGMYYKNMVDTAYMDFYDLSSDTTSKLIASYFTAEGTKRVFKGSYQKLQEVKATQYQDKFLAESSIMDFSLDLFNVGKILSVRKNKIAYIVQFQPKYKVGYNKIEFQVYKDTLMPFLIQYYKNTELIRELRVMNNTQEDGKWIVLIYSVANPVDDTIVMVKKSNIEYNNKPPQAVESLKQILLPKMALYNNEGEH